MTSAIKYCVLWGTFYVPGVLVLIGALALGYDFYEVRDFVGVVGIILGVFSVLVTGITIFGEKRK